MGVWGRSPQPPEERGSVGRAPSVWRFLQFFNENNTFSVYYTLKFLLKNIILILLYNDLATKHFFF